MALANEIIVDKLDKEFSSAFGCKKFANAGICYSSIQRNSDDFIIDVTVNMYANIEYLQDKHFSYLVKVTNKFYAMFNKRTARFLSEPYEIDGLDYDLTRDFEDRFVVVFTYIFKNKTIKYIYDYNNTAYVTYDGELSVFDVLKKHRSSSENRSVQYFNPEKLDGYYTTSREVYRTSVHEVIETPAMKDMETGEVTNVGDTVNTGEFVRVRKLISHQVVYFNFDEG